MSFCSQCGTPNAEDARFCEKCGSAMAGAAPSSSAAEPAAQVADQAKAALGTVVVAAKKLNPLIPIGAIVLVVLLVVAFVTTRPMDKREYKKQAENYAEDICDSTSEISTAIWELSYNYEDIEDEMDAGDVEDLRGTFEDESTKIREAARSIERLRPPSDYRDADKDLRLWADWVSNDWLSLAGDVIKQAEEQGMTYEDFEDILADFSDEDSDAGDDAYDALSDAADELNIDPYGASE